MLVVTVAAVLCRAREDPVEAIFSGDVIWFGA
jgi:hypothetical protein